MTKTTLHLLCGKIASGKSTLARSLAAQHSAMLLSEDNWLSKLYPEQIKSMHQREWPGRMTRSSPTRLARA